jgi:hypothetical protein
MSGVPGNQQQQQRSHSSSLHYPQPSATQSVFRSNRQQPFTSSPRLGPFFRDVPLTEGLLKGGISPLKFQHAWIIEAVSHVRGMSLGSMATKIQQ